MRYNLKIFTRFFFILFLFSFFIFQNIEFSLADTSQITSYTLLEPLSTTSKTVSLTESGTSEYFNSVFIYSLIIMSMISVFFLMYYGLVYLTTDIVNRKLEGREGVLKVITGLVFVFCAWILLNSINPDLLKNGLNFGGVEQENDSATPIETTTDPTSPRPATTPANPPSGTDQDLARRLLANSKFSISSKYRGQIKDIADGKGGCNVDTSILKSMVYLVEDKGISINVSSINRKCTETLTTSGASSYHYKDGGGHAFDISGTNGRDAKAKQIINSVYSLYSNAAYGQKGCPGGEDGLPPVKTFVDSCNHLHIQIPY